MKFAPSSLTARINKPHSRTKTTRTHGDTALSSNGDKFVLVRECASKHQKLATGLTTLHITQEYMKKELATVRELVEGLDARDRQYRSMWDRQFVNINNRLDEGNKKFDELNHKMNTPPPEKAIHIKYSTITKWIKRSMIPALGALAYLVYWLINILHLLGHAT